MVTQKGLKVQVKQFKNSDFRQTLFKTSLFYFTYIKTPTRKYKSHTSIIQQKKIQVKINITQTILHKMKSIMKENKKHKSSAKDHALITSRKFCGFF